ncbi:porin, partial [Burkholderia sola]|uniref:porin n=1 Tax=Burkholderia sola TaxID=2843302 RepID=UPI0023DD71BB
DAMNVLLVTSLFAAILSFHNTITRYFYAMGRERVLWRKLGHTCPVHRCPDVAGKVQTLIALAAIAGSAAFRLDPFAVVFSWMSALATIGIIAVQILVAASVIAFLTMKKMMAAVSAASAMGFGLTAHAQSTVTLYGLIDEGVNFTSNAGGSKAYQMVSGDTVGSNWGLKGTEDLGGGLRALFQLENGFNASTGALGVTSRCRRPAYTSAPSACLLRPPSTHHPARSPPFATHRTAASRSPLPCSSHSRHPLQRSSASYLSRQPA